MSGNQRQVIDATYGHLVSDTFDRVRRALEARALRETARAADKSTRQLDSGRSSSTDAEHEGLINPSEAHSLLLPFDTDEPAFARGFELGRLWATLQADPAHEVEEFVHAANAEMLVRIGEATGRTFSALDTDDEWILVTYLPAEV